jgi:hypothetical protein
VGKKGTSKRELHYKMTHELMERYEGWKCLYLVLWNAFRNMTDVNKVKGVILKG